jgi:CheY-like chemotaxis protein
MTATTNRKILVVDDEVNIRRMVRGMLANDYVVLEATDGKEAVKLARTERPDLILMDIMMPGMDGYTSLSQIKADPVSERIPVLMLTAVGFELNVKLSRELGAAGYITKPFRSEDLKNSIGANLRV